MVFNWLFRLGTRPITNRVEEIAIDIDDNFNAVNRSKLLGPNYRKIYWSQAWPNILSSIWHRFMITFMIMVLSRSSAVKSSSYSVVSPIITIINAMAHWIGAGVNYNMSYYMGQNNDNMAEVTLANGVYFSLITGGLQTILYASLAKFIVPGFGGTGPEKDGAIQLLYTISAFPIFYNLSHVASAVFRAHGMVLWNMLATMTSSFLAFVISLGTVARRNGGTVAFAVSLGLDPLICTVFSFIIITFNKNIRIKFNFRRYSTIVFQIITRGASGALNQFANMIMVIVLDEAINKIADPLEAPKYLASRGTTFSLLAIVEHLGVALSLSTTLPMASMARGSSMFIRFQQINNYSLKMSFIVVFTASLLFLGSSWFMPRAYFSDPEYRNVMKQFMMIVFCGSAFISPVLSLTELLQSNGYSILASLVAVMRNLLIDTPIILITMYSTKNVWIVVSCLFIGDISSSLISSLIIYLERNKLLLTKTSATLFNRRHGDSYTRL